MALGFDTIAFLLLIAGVVAMVTRRLHLPYSAGLVAAGIVLALLPYAPSASLTKDLIFKGLLPPLIFEAAFYLEWRLLRRDLALISVLATLGVVLSAAITAVGMHYFAGWAGPEALLFGVLIAATDPVSVIATFKEAKAQGRLLLLIESESILNDGTAAVAFGVALSLLSGQSVSPLAVVGSLLTTVAGGVVCGALVAGAVISLAGRTHDHLVEITFTTVAAYGSFLLAENLHLSGVLATLTAGVVLGNVRDVITPRGREAVEAFWEYAAFVANSLVFLLIGMRGAGQNFGVIWRSALIAIVLVTLGRALAIYPCCLLFARSSLRVKMRHQHVLFWGGLRGALALALALGLPAELPGREMVISTSFAVVAFSVFVQGLTMTPLLRATGEIART